MKRLIILLTVLWSGSSVAQQTIIGTVSSEFGEPLSNAHVLDIQSRNATVTDTYGKFELSVADSGTTLRISHVGFKPVLKEIDELSYYQTELVKNLTFRLKQESTVLEMVSVSPPKDALISGRRGVVLKDFSFANDYILLIAEDGIRYLVHCDDGWKEKSRLRVDKKGYKLYDDCMGNTHLFGEDSVYQINVSGEKPQLEFAFSTSTFLNELAHCATSSNSHLFFSSYNKAGQEVYHYGLHRETKEGTILQRVYDHEGLEEIETYFESIAKGRRPSGYRNIPAGAYYESVSINPALSRANRVGFIDNYGLGNPFWGNGLNRNGISAIREGTRRMSRVEFNTMNFGTSAGSYYRMVNNRLLDWQSTLANTWSPSPQQRGWLDLLSQPTYSPMFSVRDSIYVFDHVIGVCFVHDSEGNEVRSFPITHHELKGWRNTLIADEEREKVYAHLKRSNKIYLVEVDLVDGSLGRSVQIQDALYSDHLKVRDGYAYYLKEYRDIQKSDELKRQKL